jgi:ubiquilin
MLQQVLRNPEMRRMMFSPEMMRMQLQMQRDMGGAPGGGSSFPAPGATDNTPQAGGATATPNQPGGNVTAPPNPFAAFGGAGAGAGAGAGGANPFASLFAGSQNPLAPQQGAGGNTGAAQDPASTFPNLFGGAGAQGQANPIAEAAQRMMQNPEAMRNMMQMMGGAGAGANPFGATDQPPAGSQPPANNPFAALFGPGGFGAGGFGQPPAAPADTRPPEEVYETQLRQLNEMGFYEFDRNVSALRRSGGNVQGAIEYLLNGEA